jgi:hypothetical protein
VANCARNKLTVSTGQSATDCAAVIYDDTVQSSDQQSVVAKKGYQGAVNNVGIRWAAVVHGGWEW